MVREDINVKHNHVRRPLNHNKVREHINLKHRQVRGDIRERVE